MSLTIGTLRESAPRETRVSLVPEVADKLAREGARVLMERGAGVRASFPDSLYKSVTWADSAASVLAGSDVILTVQPLTVEQIEQLKPGAVVVGFMQPHARALEVRALKAHGVTSFAMELVPRISRAQSMDALSSQASIAGYKAVLIAASQLQKFLPMLTTAAGTIRPSQLLIIGAGVAGGAARAPPRHHPPGAAADHRRGSGGTAGDRHRQTPGRDGRALRRAQRHPRAGEVPRSQVRRYRRECGGDRRLRARAHRGGERQAAGSARLAHRRGGCGGHDRIGPRAHGTEDNLARRGGTHARRIRGGRHRR